MPMYVSDRKLDKYIYFTQTIISNQIKSEYREFNYEI